ncbi:iron-enterobactin transporter permease [Sphaerisporangium krabiense]|uniref:Iron complex transport system permease protein n=1 Tax=Sphaerisporangium krabiense TaxID=763782 RepID=A0A7W8Z4H0_9ACTN|nr:iron chelate uptake ABC transporter family permease subunit [Sphaerisporangium krabiense]MBB5627274.1 iron complex transport system permease protein [Sphaerisporangium krabiense]GII64592.1 iron-enterobactin transporter permease [Sphaerisporangium krabiense]
MNDLVLRAGRFSVRIERRTTVVSLVLVAVALLLAVFGLCYGASWTTPSDALSALAGHGDSAFVVREWRAPRVAAALVFGASLGLAGAIFQNITRNPLGSPDVIGLDAGAYTGALISITVLGGTAVQLAVGSILGGLLTAAAVYFLSLGSGLSGLRLIVIGIAMNAILTAVNSWIVLRAELEIAMAATGWSSGSLNGVEWAGVRLPFLVIGVLTLLLVTLSHAMHQSALGDELAVTSGVALDRLRLLLVLAGVGCTATVTAVAGPIVFIALAAPQIGRRLARAGGVPPASAALTGAVLLLAADLIAQLLLAPVALPVGVVTTAIGGCYLIWLLVKEVRRP